MSISAKQQEYLLNANHRWNCKSGATRSGKTYLDTLLVIPKRIRKVAGKEGLIIFLGNTKGTLQRNVIEPLQMLYGPLVGDIRSDNTAMIFGEKVYCLGADKVNQVNRLRGSSIRYCYCDEVVTFNQEVFEMLKSRLDKEYSRCDMTCNPDNPSHWFKKFLESDADIYLQEYTIDDNPFLPSNFVEELKKEYLGTVYYDRYILGKWCNAEGLLFPQYANNIKDYRIDQLPYFQAVNVGLDIGGTKSHSTLVGTGIAHGYSQIVSFMEKKIVHAKGTIDTNRICQETANFVRSLQMTGYKVACVFVDNAEQVILNSIRGYLKSQGIKVAVQDCKKVKGSTRILLYNLMFNLGMLRFKNVPVVEESLSTALYDDSKDEDTILDDFTTDIDTFDAHFYSWSYYVDAISTRLKNKGAKL